MFEYSTIIRSNLECQENVPHVIFQLRLKTLICYIKRIINSLIIP